MQKRYMFGTYRFFVNGNEQHNSICLGAIAYEIFICIIPSLDVVSRFR